MIITNSGPFNAIFEGDTSDRGLALSFQAWGGRDDTTTCLVVSKGDDDLGDALLSLDDMQQLVDALNRHIDARVRHVITDEPTISHGYLEPRRSA